MVIDRFRDFEAAAAHVADRPDWPEEAGNDAERREPGFLGPAEDAHLQAGLRFNRLSKLRPVRSATHGLRRHGVDSSDAHGVGDGAKSPHGLDRSTKMVRRDCAGLGQSFGETGKRFFIEARHRRPAELVIDQEPDRVRADVDDRIGRPVGPLGALGVELKRPQRPFRGLNVSLRHRVSPPRSYHRRRRRPADGSVVSVAQTGAGIPLWTERSAA